MRPYAEEDFMATVAAPIDATSTAAWKALEAHQEKLEAEGIDLKAWFAADAERVNKLSFDAGDLHFDLSKNLVTDETVKLLCDLAREVKLEERRDAMFSGEHINTTEDRAVLHTALRRPASEKGQLIVDGQDVVADVHEVLDRMYAFAERVRSGEWKGVTGKKIEHLVSIGIGGSDLGPVMAYEALRPYADAGIDCRYISNIDPNDLAEKTKGLDPETTLFIIVFPGVIARHLFPGIEKPDMIYPTMVLRLLPTGLLGIMLSALLAALTSTLSAILNSTSTLFTMDFYAKIDKRADERKLVRVGKLASLVIIVIAALWAPQIGRFGSLLKYYQEMLSYIAPPVVAAFLMGVFSRRANGRGAFAGLIAGLVVAAAMLLWRTEIFGGMHFLLIVPFLLVFSLSVIWAVSRTAPAPRPDKLIDTTFSAADFRAETRSLAEVSWWRNYRVWGGVLLVLCMLILIIFR